MNILDISYSPIYPPNEGASIGIYQRLKMLKEKEHKVFCVFPILPRMKNEIEIIKNHLFNNFDGYFFLEQKNDKINILNPILPYSVIRNKANSDELNLIKKIIIDNKIDLIIFEGTYIGEIYYQLSDIINNKKIKKVFFSHNIDYKDMFNLSKDSNNILLKFYYLFESIKLFFYEYKLMKKMDKIFSVSYEEHLNIQKATNIKTIWIPLILHEINNELTLEEKIVYNELKNKFNNNYIILFTGILNKSSNIRAAIWFSKKVLPLILKSIKEVKFFIVGKKPVKELYKIQNSNILLFPDVPSIKPYFLLSNLTVNPIFNSAGVKVKLLESLLYKKMVVSTSKGLNGSGLSDIVPNADDPEGFAKLCIDSLLGNINFETIFKNFNNIYNNTKNFELFEEELKS